MPRIHTRCFTDLAELQAALADRLERALTRASAPQPPAAVMLAGGATPLPAYRLLAGRAPRPAAGTRILFSDERQVPADSPASNFHQARVLLDALALPDPCVLRVHTELPLADAAADYARRLSELERAAVPIGLGLLGLGADGHTASLFSARDLERARGHLAIAVHRPDGRDAVSVTPQLLARVAQPLFVVAGIEKRNALGALLGGRPDLVAAQAVAGCASVEVWTEPQALGSTDPGAAPPDLPAP